jgi:CysZ protein
MLINAAFAALRQVFSPPLRQSVDHGVVGRDRVGGDQRRDALGQAEPHQEQQPDRGLSKGIAALIAAHPISTDYAMVNAVASFLAGAGPSGRGTSTGSGGAAGKTPAAGPRRRR